MPTKQSKTFSFIILPLICRFVNSSTFEKKKGLAIIHFDYLRPSCFQISLNKAASIMFCYFNNTYVHIGIQLIRL